MLIMVRSGMGFNREAIASWAYEMVTPEPPVTQSQGTPPAEGTQEVEPGAQESGGDVHPPPAPAQVEAPVATLTLTFIGGSTLVLEGDEAERVKAFFSVPSSYLTVL